MMLDKTAKRSHTTVLVLVFPCSSGFSTDTAIQITNDLRFSGPLGNTFVPHTPTTQDPDPIKRTWQNLQVLNSIFPLSNTNPLLDPNVFWV